MLGVATGASTNLELIWQDAYPYARRDCAVTSGEKAEKRIQVVVLQRFEDMLDNAKDTTVITPWLCWEVNVVDRDCTINNTIMIGQSFRHGAR